MLTEKRKPIADEYADAFRKKAVELGATAFVATHEEILFEISEEGHAALMAWSSAWFREKLAELAPIQAEPTMLGKWSQR